MEKMITSSAAAKLARAFKDIMDLSNNRFIELGKNDFDVISDFERAEEECGVKLVNEHFIANCYEKAGIRSKKKEEAVRKLMETL